MLFRAEFPQQLFAAGHNDGGGADIPLLSNDDRLPPTGLHPAQSDPLRYIQLDLSELRPRRRLESHPHLHLRLVRHLPAANRHYNAVTIICR